MHKFYEDHQVTLDIAEIGIAGRCAFGVESSQGRCDFPKA
jgi:hypothetical protein